MYNIHHVPLSHARRAESVVEESRWLKVELRAEGEAVWAAVGVKPAWAGSGVEKKASCDGVGCAMWSGRGHEMKDGAG